MSRLFSLLLILGALIVLPGTASAATIDVPPIPAGPSTVTATVSGADAIDSVGLRGGPDELTVGTPVCVRDTCTVPLAMAKASGRDLSKVDPQRVATLSVVTASGSTTATLAAAPSLRVEINAAVRAANGLIAVIAVILVMALAAFSVMMIEADPGLMYRLRPDAWRARVLAGSWVAGMAPLVGGIISVIALDGSARAFLYTTAICGLMIAPLRLFVVWQASGVAMRARSTT